MLQGFKDFIMRGNVIDLAVAVVIGSAFAAVVDVVVTSLLTPILNAAGGAQIGRLGVEIIAGQENTFVDLAAIINAVTVFVITAAVVYFLIVLPMNKLNERRARGQEAEPEPVGEDIALLTEIRDLLARREGTGAS
ncbi:large conductance mechanosensitive channel protein MscL [Ornithinicoccus halotolerans]|uniref:large conductance mechanosensitive channel protein MscL n=1 Tax=Ornithinicoccus halotolerans TaxID=1748220 RepID=UPI001296CD65|nr:large conductance mechanosensitive channel protein MscL [Ornithinicoccus halotolerans]